MGMWRRGEPKSKQGFGYSSTGQFNLYIEVVFANYTRVTPTSSCRPERAKVNPYFPQCGGCISRRGDKLREEFSRLPPLPFPLLKVQAFCVLGPAG
jgi:hypothetical protein